MDSFEPIAVSKFALQDTQITYKHHEREHTTGSCMMHQSDLSVDRIVVPSIVPGDLIRLPRVMMLLLTNGAFRASRGEPCLLFGSLVKYCTSPLFSKHLDSSIVVSISSLSSFVLRNRFSRLSWANVKESQNGTFSTSIATMRTRVP